MGAMSWLGCRLLEGQVSRLEEAGCWPALAGFSTIMAGSWLLDFDRAATDCPGSFEMRWSLTLRHSSTSSQTTESMSTSSTIGLSRCNQVVFRSFMAPIFLPFGSRDLESMEASLQ